MADRVFTNPTTLPQERTHSTSATGGGTATGINTGDETKATIDAKIGATGGTTAFYRQDGAFAVPPAGGGGVTDGDKGQIVVSGGGTVWSLDTGAAVANLGFTPQVSDPQLTDLAGLVYAGNAGKAIVVNAAASGVELVDLGVATNQLFTTMTTIGPTVTMFETAGYSQVGVGAARYIYDAAVNAAFVTANPVTSKMFGARGFRIDETQRLTIDMFGAVSTNWPTIGIDCLPAWNAFQAFVRARPRNDFGILEGAPELLFPGACYYFTDTIQLKTTVRLRGMGSGYSGGSSTMLRFAAGKAGIVVNRFDTLGDVAESPTTTGGDGSIIEGFYLFGGGGAPDLLKSGIRMRSRAKVRDCLIAVFPGAGVCIVAAVGSPVGNPYAGNANNWQLDGVRAQSNGFGGFYVSGGDANAGVAVMLDASKNRLFGFWDSAFLGNTYVACHSDINGALSNYTGFANQDTSVVSHAGNRYYIKQGQEALGAATTPGTDPNVWVFMGAGGPVSEIPAWGTTGVTYTSGGGYFQTGSANKCLFDGCYYEGGQAPPQIEGAAIVINGFMGDGLSTGAPFLQGSLGQGLKQQRHYTQAITYGDGTTGSVSLGGPVVGNTQPILQWASFLSTPTNANKPSFLFHDGPTGDVYWDCIGIRTPFRWTGNLTARAYQGRPQTENRFITEIDTLALGNGLGSTPNDNLIVRRGSAPPTTGTWGRGDIIFNTGAVTTIANANHWRCTVAGTPGTWLAISAPATTAVAGTMSAADKTKLDAITGTNTGDQFTNVTSSRILGRVTAGFGAAEELTGTQATALLNPFTDLLKGLAPASGGGTTNFLRADGTWAAPPAGGGAVADPAPFTLLDVTGSHIAARAAGTYWLGQGQPAGITGVGTLYAPNLIYLDPLDYPASGSLTAKLRVRLIISVNDVAPGTNFVIGLHPVTKPATSGGAGLVIHAIGAAVAGTTVTATAPAVDSLARFVSAEFAVPTAGFYCIGFVTNAAVAASSHVHLSGRLVLRYA